jgi:hypothetical protein
MNIEYTPFGLEREIEEAWRKVEAFGAEARIPRKVTPVELSILFNYKRIIVNFSFDSLAQITRHLLGRTSSRAGDRTVKSMTAFRKVATWTWCLLANVR